MTKAARIRELLVQKKTPKEIAEELGVKVNTVYDVRYRSGMGPRNGRKTKRKTKAPINTVQVVQKIRTDPELAIRLQAEPETPRDNLLDVVSVLRADVYKLQILVGYLESCVGIRK